MHHHGMCVTRERTLAWLLNCVLAAARVVVVWCSDVVVV